MFSIPSSLYALLHYTAFSTLFRTTFLTLWSDQLTTLLSYRLVRLFSLYVMFLLRCDLPRFSSLAFTLLWSNMIIPLSSVWSDLLPLISDLLNSDCSAHDLICLLWSSWISSLRSALSFVPLDLLIYLKITHHCITHHLLLACTIT